MIGGTGAYLVVVCGTLPIIYSVWDIEEGTKLITQFNSPARITAAEFLNPHDISFLLTGSGDYKFSMCMAILVFP